MKRLFFVATMFVLLGVGCTSSQKTYQPGKDSLIYYNPEYAFVLNHAQGIEVRNRAQDVRAFKYVGLDVDFFASIRDLVSSKEPESYAYLYAAQGLSVEAFVQALDASDPSVEILSVEKMPINDLSVTHVTSTTQAQIDKHHYLFETDGMTVIISEFLHKQEAFEPILKSLRKI